jgi:hypothetical protein
MTLTPGWVQVQLVDGDFMVMFDPVYLAFWSIELDKRILAHLGKTDVTPRLFDPSFTFLKTIPYSPSFNQVLDG